MIKTIRVAIEFIGEGNSKKGVMIVNVDRKRPITIKEFNTELELLLLKFGDITIPEISD